jgi:hypothetical protein
MEWLLALGLLVLLVYLLLDQPIIPTRIGRLCDYKTVGSVYEDIPTALARGVRLLELHVYSDEQDEPIVATRPQQLPMENIPLERACVDIVNGAFPSKDPFVLSIVVHSDKTVLMDKIAYHLQTTLPKHMIPDKDVHLLPMNKLANKLILVSGGSVSGSKLEELLNMSWSDSHLRRLSPLQATSPRDPEELIAYAKENIVMVAPDGSSIQTGSFQLDGFQWNFFGSGPTGFLSRT